MGQIVTGINIIRTEFDMYFPYFYTKMVSDDVEKQYNLMNIFMGY